MPYKVLVPEVSVLEKVGELRNDRGEFVSHEHVSKTYLQDEYVPDETISPTLVEKYDDGDEHTTSVLEYVEKVEEAVETPKRAPRAKKSAVTEVPAEAKSE